MNRFRKKFIFIGVLVLLLGGASSALATFVAADTADNDPYPVSGFFPGDNGGFGFNPWVKLAAGTPGAMYTTAALDEGSYAWGINGTYALGRELSTHLSVGSWTFLAVHDPDNTSFSGFNLKTSPSGGSFAADELFRVGVDSSQVGGLSISTNAGADYLFLDCGWVDGAGDTIEYTIGWNTDDGIYSLSVSNQTEEVSATFNGTILAGSSVAMLGAGLFGADNSESLTFGNYGVVPEPGSLCLLFFGVLVMSCLRRLRI